MDFAPYQDTSPETQRTLSPPPRRSQSFSPRVRSPDMPQQSAPAGGPFASRFSGSGAGGGLDPETAGVGRSALDEFATSLPIRLDYEACLAYVLLPPAGGVFLLLVERKSDYVRFHAWQSSLLFSVIFLLHLIFLWSPFLSWLLFAGDLVLIAYLTYRAYLDADTLDRFEVPLFGHLASRFLDDE